MGFGHRPRRSTNSLTSNSLDRLVHVANSLTSNSLDRLVHVAIEERNDPSHASWLLNRWRKSCRVMARDCSASLAVCAGTVYWAGIGAVVFGVTEARLGELTGDHPENLTMDLPARTVFAAGRRDIDVRGPFPELESEVLAAHEGFWD